MVINLIILAGRHLLLKNVPIISKTQSLLLFSNMLENRFINL